MTGTRRVVLLGTVVLLGVAVVTGLRSFRDSGALPAEDVAPIEALVDTTSALSWREQVEALSDRYRNVEDVEALGYVSADDDKFTEWHHYFRWPVIDDDRILDPEEPEALLYKVTEDGGRELVAIVFMLPLRYNYANTSDIGGGTGVWHLHPTLCFAGDPFSDPQLGRVDLTCPQGANAPQSLMVHAWVVPNACGPFAPALLERTEDELHGLEIGVDEDGNAPGCAPELARLAWPELGS